MSELSTGGDKMRKRAAFWHNVAISTSTLEAPTALNETLRLFGMCEEADRSWILRYNADYTLFWNTHEWARHGVRKFVGELQAASISLMGPWHPRFLRGEIVPVPNVEKMPRQTRSLQAEFRRQNIKSTVSAPIMIDGVLKGIYGCDYVRRHEIWSSGDLEFLAEVGKVLAGLLYRKQISSSLDEPNATMPTEKVIYVREAGVTRAMEIDQLILIRSDGDYTHLHFQGGENFMELRSLKSWEDDLPAEFFRRVHKRYIIQTKSIDRLERNSKEGWRLYIKGWPEAVPVGRTYRYLLRQSIGV